MGEWALTLVKLLLVYPVFLIFKIISYFNISLTDFICLVQKKNFFFKILTHEFSILKIFTFYFLSLSLFNHLSIFVFVFSPFFQAIYIKISDDI